MRKNFNKRTILIVTAIAVTIGVASFLILRRDPVEAAGRKAIQSVFKNDGDRLVILMGDQMKGTVLDSPKAAQNLLDEYVAPVLRDLEPIGSIQFSSNVAYSQGIASQQFRRSDGEVFTLNFLVHRSDDGAVVPYLITNLIFFIQEVKYFNEIDGESRSLATARAWLHGAENDGEFLTSLGVTGMVREFSEGVFSWEEYAGLQRDRIEKILQQYADAKSEAEAEAGRN